jgi:hypothetical protein
MHDHDRSSVRGIKPREKCVREEETIQERVQSKKQTKNHHARARRRRSAGGGAGTGTHTREPTRSAAQSTAGFAARKSSSVVPRRRQQVSPARTARGALCSGHGGGTYAGERSRRHARRRTVMMMRKNGKSVRYGDVGAYAGVGCGSDVSPRTSDGVSRSIPGRRARCRTRPCPSSAPCPIQTLIPVSITQAPPEPAHAPRFISPKRAPGGPAHSCPSASRKW